MPRSRAALQRREQIGMTFFSCAIRDMSSSNRQGIVCFSSGALPDLKVENIKLENGWGWQTDYIVIVIWKMFQPFFGWQNGFRLQSRSSWRFWSHRHPCRSQRCRSKSQSFPPKMDCPGRCGSLSWSGHWACHSFQGTAQASHKEMSVQAEIKSKPVPDPKDWSKLK